MKFDVGILDIDNIYFTYELNLNHIENIYYRKRSNIGDIFGYIGGLFNILFILGNLITSFYNRSLLSNRLINYSFKSEKMTKTNEKKFKNLNNILIYLK